MATLDRHRPATTAHARGLVGANQEARVATSTKTRRSTSSKSRGSSSRSKTTKRSAKGSTKARKGPGVASRVGQAFRTHVGDQSTDVYGIGLILLAVLIGLGMYIHAAGPVGAFLEAVFRGLLGVWGYLVPPVLLYFGVVVVIGRPGPEIGRVAVGGALTALSLIGGWHLTQGTPIPADGIRALWPASGLAGWAVAHPLRAALSIWGATAVLLAVGMLGLLIVTRTPVSTVIEWVVDLFRGRGDDAATDEEATPTRRTKRAPDPDAEPEAAATEPVGAPSRATLSGRAYEQPPLADDEDEGGLNAADREAGRAPAPPTPVLTADGKKKAAKVRPIEDWADYQLPPLDLLGKGRSLGSESRRHIEAQVEALQGTFHQFGIDATVARWSRGPTVTRFEIELGPGVQVKKVANMGDDIAYALAAPDVRIVAPIPGKSAIGVEVPNRQRDLITLGDILRSDDAQANAHPLYVALGVDIAGNAALVNLATMPHLLVSGATGSGKSVTLNAMITSVLVRARPDQVKMILIDPKRVELNHYDGAPHLLTPVVTDPKRATDAVQWCVKEMEMRYEKLARLGYRNIDGYNEAVERGEIEQAVEANYVDPEAAEAEAESYAPMPYVLLVIDELADLMLVAPRDVEEAICRLAQMARAVGMATQRPSVDVITGLIKANIPSRLALAVASQTDSRTILDMGGAEKLVGHGDMLFLPASQGKPSRLQGCFIGEREIGPVVTYCRQQRQVDYVEGVVKEGSDAEATDLSRGGDDDSDETLVRRAAEQVVNSGLGSTSMLQRKLRIGFARAGRIMDELEQLGVVGPNEGSKARDVIWTPEDLDNALQQGRF
jgi:DNA segregation ATPase FtsK/SpoIIIE, S-DNA-T family